MVHNRQGATILSLDQEKTIFTPHKVETHFMYTQLLYNEYLKNDMTNPKQSHNNEPQKIPHTNEIPLVVQKIFTVTTPTIYFCVLR